MKKATKIKKLEKEIEALKKEVEMKFKRKIRPHGEEKFWCIDREGYIGELFWNEEDVWSIGNGFFTKEEAEKELDKRLAIQRVKDYIKKNFGVFKPDWKDGQQHKYRIYFHFGDMNFHESGCIEFKDSVSIPYLKTKYQAKQVIADCLEDLLVIFEIEGK